MAAYSPNLTSKISFVLTTLLVSHLSYAQDAFNIESKWMFGDWNGQRNELQKQGVDFSFGYTGEMAQLLSDRSRSRSDTQYTGQLALGVHLDLQKIAGWQDTEAQITVTHRDGQSLSQTADVLQGHLSSVQEVWGRGQTWHLTDLWIKKKILDQKLDIKVGRFGEGEDFNSFNCDFQNLSLCGSQVGNWVGDQWYNWPVSQWAGRVKYSINPELYTQIGVYEYNPENLKRGKGFNLSTDGSKGAVIPTELVWMPKIGTQKLPGEYRAGYYYSTADAAVIGTHTEKMDHHHGAWLVAKQQLTVHEGDAHRGLHGFVNLTVHDNKTNPIRDMQNIGLIYQGAMDARPHDEIAFGVGRIRINDDVQDGRKQEINAELYYGVQATPWLTIRPNIQYVHHVGAEPKGENVWVGGLKVITAF